MLEILVKCKNFEHLLMSKLTVVELGIEGVAVQQLNMRALLDDVAVLHNQNKVGVLNG